MLNTLLFASLAISGVAGVAPDSVVNKDVSLNEVVVTDFKQNKRNLTSIAVSTINSQQLLNQQIVNLKELTAVMPNGTLYGRNTIAGVINVYTHNPLDYQKMRIKVGYGMYNDVVAQASNYSKLTDKLGLSSAISYHHNDGMFTNQFLNEDSDFTGDQP